MRCCGRPVSPAHHAAGMMEVTAGDVVPVGDATVLVVAFSSSLGTRMFSVANAPWGTALG